jgi:uncharacterized membrane protein
VNEQREEAKPTAASPTLAAPTSALSDLTTRRDQRRSFIGSPDAINSPSDAHGADLHAATPPPIPPHFAAASTAAPTRSHVIMPLASLGEARSDVPPLSRDRFTAPPKPQKTTLSVEQFIGTKFYAAVGALVVVAGIGFFVKFAYDQGWMKMPPALKCSLGAGFGLLLIGVGEYLRKKVNALAASGIYAAGIGSVFASTYAAFRFELLSPPLAFAMLALTAAVGIAIGARAGLVIVSVLSLLGGYGTPLLFANQESGPYVLPAYLLALLAVGLVLAGWLGLRFSVLRTVVWWGTALLGLAWVFNKGMQHEPVALSFVLVVWGAIHAEILWAARRNQLTGIAPSGDERSGFYPSKLMWTRWRPIMSSFSTTSWTVVLGVLLLRHWVTVPDWLMPAGLMVATAMLAQILAGHLRPLLDQPRTDSDRIGACLLIQSAGLLIGTIALAFAGWVQVLAWVMLGLGAVIAGGWIKARAFHVYGLIFLALGLVRLFLLDSRSTVLTLNPVDAFGFSLTTWSLATFLACAATIAAGLLVRRGASAEWKVVGHIVAAVGMTAIGGTLLLNATTHATRSIAFVFAAAGVLTLGAFLNAGGLLIYAVVLLLPATLILGLTEWWDALPAQSTTIASLIIPNVAPAFLLVAAAWIASACVLQRRTGSGWTEAARIAFAAGIAVLFALLVHRDVGAAPLCIAWLIISAALPLLTTVIPRLVPSAVALGGSLATACAWGYFYILDQRWGASTAPLALHPALWIGFLVAAVSIYTSEMFARREPATSVVARQSRAMYRAIALLIVFTSTSFEVARIAGTVANDQTARGAAVSIWWGLFAVAMIVAGFKFGVSIVRHIGLGLMAIAGVKACVFDLAHVPQIWRIASFVGLGLLMLGVSVLYSRVAVMVGAASGSPSAPNRPGSDGEIPLG